MSVPLQREPSGLFIDLGVITGRLVGVKLRKLLIQRVRLLDPLAKDDDPGPGIQKADQAKRARNAGLRPAHHRLAAVREV